MVSVDLRSVSAQSLETYHNVKRNAEGSIQFTRKGKGH